MKQVKQWDVVDLEGFSELSGNDRDYIRFMGSNSILTTNELRVAIADIIKHNRKEKENVEKAYETWHIHPIPCIPWTTLIQIIQTVATLNEADRYFLLKGLVVEGFCQHSLIDWLERREFMTHDLIVDLISTYETRSK